MIKLFNIDDKNWQEDMDLVEKLIEETKVKKKDSEHEDPRYRLKAVDAEEVEKRKVGVQHKSAARIAKMKFTRPCNSCCCLSHYEKNPHSGENDVQVVMSSLELPDVKEVEFEGMVDKSWMLEMADYEAELLETVPYAQDKFMSVLCSVNMDLEVVVEVD